MFPLQFVDEIRDTLEFHFTELDGYKVQTEPLDPTSLDKYLSVFPQTWTPDPETTLIGNREPAINHYQIKLQNLVIHGDIQAAYTQMTNDQRKIRAILYRDATLSVALGAMQEDYLGSRERFKRLIVTRQSLLQGRRNFAMYFLCETDIQIDTETTKL
jgi:hypothetical protein